VIRKEDEDTTETTYTFKRFQKQESIIFSTLPIPFVVEISYIDLETRAKHHFITHVKYIQVIGNIDATIISKIIVHTDNNIIVTVWLDENNIDDEHVIFQSEVEIPPITTTTEQEEEITVEIHRDSLMYFELSLLSSINRLGTDAATVRDKDKLYTASWIHPNDIFTSLIESLEVMHKNKRVIKKQTTYISGDNLELLKSTFIGAIGEYSPLPLLLRSPYTEETIRSARINKITIHSYYGDILNNDTINLIHSVELGTTKYTVNISKNGGVLFTDLTDDNKKYHNEVSYVDIYIIYIRFN